MRASWIDGAVAEFGRHFGFEHFALNDRGVAAARFENGASIALEYARESLCLQVRVPMAADGASLRKLLVAAHPGNRFPFPLRHERLNTMCSTRLAAAADESNTVWRPDQRTPPSRTDNRRKLR